MEEIFPGAGFPLVFWYMDSPGAGIREKGAGSARHACVVCELARARRGEVLVLDQLAKIPLQPAPAPFLVFARWDRWKGAPEPLAAVFFASPDVLSGLFTLANYDESDLMHREWGQVLQTNIIWLGPDHRNE